MKISTYNFLIFSDIGFMEVISFVQDSRPSRKINLPLFQKNNYSSGFSTEIRNFSIKKVSGPFSIKIFFMELGRSITESSELIFENLSKIALSSIIMLALLAAGWGAFKAGYYFENFTGPLSIQASDGSDIENLNKIMSEFALDGSQDVAEDGSIADAAIPLKNSYTSPVSFQTYTVQYGDAISTIARKFGLTNVGTLISVNDISNVRQLAAGQKLKIPSVDGIIYTVKAGDSINSIVEKNKISLKELLDVNDMTSERLHTGHQLFLPRAALDQKTLKTAMGDRFIMPISAKFRWSSPFGWREDPIAHVRSFHTGTDMACPTGTPILASMSGKVITTGVNRVYGNYVIIDHGNGYQTLYAHMSKIIAQKGQWVSQGTRIGLVGSTGYSTGPHLHFTVYKNGKMVNPLSVLK